MSLHVFGAVLTSNGVAANNRGESEGNITTLQKLLWHGRVHTTVSSEALRWAIRYYWQFKGIPVNREWKEDKQDHKWQDQKQVAWMDPEGKGKDKPKYIDDDVLGFMEAKGAKTEGEKGTADRRRGVLEVARAISMTPYVGDITYNAKSGEKGRTSLYGTEVHATRYQYGFAMTPERLAHKERVFDTLDAIVNLGEVAGNHSRFLFDFSPESIVFRLTQDPAPRLLYCFQQEDDGTIHVPELVRRLRAGDIVPDELYIGGPIASDADLKSFDSIHLFDGVKAGLEAFKKAVRNELNRSSVGGN